MIVFVVIVYMIRIWAASVRPLDYPSFVRFAGNHCGVSFLRYPGQELPRYISNMLVYIFASVTFVHVKPA